jgi:hypothetical protein
MKRLMTAALACLTTCAAHAAVTISSGATANMNCAAGVCMPTAKKAVLNTSDLETMLAQGDVTVTTGNGAVTITLTAPLAWASMSRLTLDAAQNVSFQSVLTVQGSGALTILTDTGGTGGDLIFFPGGHADFWDLSSSLIVEGKSYTLVGDIDTLAGDAHADLNGNFALAADFDSSGESYRHSPMPPVFQGKFEGLGHTISNFRMRAPATGGRADFALFQQNAGVIRDLVMTGADVDARCQSELIAVLASYNTNQILNVRIAGKVQGGASSFAEQMGVALIAAYNYGTIANAAASGSATACGTDIYAGGITGLNDGLIKMSSSSARVKGGVDIGGLAGANVGTISQSFATGAVVGILPVNASSSPAPGGLVGVNQGTINRSWASGAVTGSEGTASFPVIAGGLVGSGIGTITRSFATGSVHVGSFSAAGGLIGASAGTIEDAYATGAVMGGSDRSAVGGLIGLIEDPATVIASYSTGAVSVGARGVQTSGLGGFLGLDQSDSRVLKDDIWDTDTSGVTDPHDGAGNVTDDPGITGLSSAQLGAGLPPGFHTGTWGQRSNINNGLPYLLANPPQ